MNTIEHPIIHNNSLFSSEVEPVIDQKWFRDHNSGYVELSDYNALLARYHARGRKINRLKATKAKLSAIIRKFKLA